MNIQLPTVLLSVLSIALGAAPLASAAETGGVVFPSVRRVGTIDRVEMTFELGGTRREKNPDATPKAKKAAANDKKSGEKEKADDVLESPISAKCALDYFEKTVAMPTGTAAAWRSVRWYQKAEAEAKEGSQKMTPKLRRERSLVAVGVDGPRSILFSPQGPLSYDELEVVDLTGNSLILDLLLPKEAVSPGAEWQLSDKVLSALLCFDSVTSSEVKCSLKEATPAVARFEVSGTLVGMKNDTASAVELKGKFRYDFHLKRIDWVGLLVAEQRDIGVVEAGYDVVLKVQIRIAADQACPALADAALKQYSLEPTSEQTRLFHESSEADWQVTADRRWYLKASHPDRAIFHLMDRGEVLSQCIVSPKSKQPFDKLPSLLDFQRDIQQALEGSFGEFQSAGENVNDAGCRILKAIVRGESKGHGVQVPIEWRYYHVADREGRQTVIVFMHEAKWSERIDSLDEQFIAGFRFRDPKNVAQGKPAETPKTSAAPKTGGAK